MKSKYPDLAKEIVELSKTVAGVERVSIADLYIETKFGEEWFFEIKSPKPNKGRCLEATGRLLQIHAITHKKYGKTKVFYATVYNPYGIEKSTHRHSFILNYMDLEKAFIEAVNEIGADYKNRIYREFLSIEPPPEKIEEGKL